MRNLFVFFIALSLGLQLSSAYGQINFQEEYLKAKLELKAGNYQQARYGFAKLLESNENNPFSLYANYFYAIAAYQSGDTLAALEKLNRVRLTHNKWDKSNEVNIWYGKLLLESGELIKGLQVLNSIDDPALKSLALSIKSNALQTYDSIPALREALELNPYDSTIAVQLAKVINRVELVNRPIALQEFLVSSFNLDEEALGVINKQSSQKKQVYNVGVMMPFIVNDLTTAKGNKANQFVLDLYQGIQTAVDQLNANGERIRIFAFDTKRDSLTTAKIISSGDLLEMDLIIGPLYPKPFMLMKEYSKEMRINMVNPLSTNSSVIGDNTYSFLLKSTPETRAKKAAAYASKNFKNKIATIFYGSNSQDSIFAYSYKNYLEADSFKVKWIAPVHSAKASTEVLRALTEVLDTDTLGNRGKVYIANTRKVRVNAEDSLLMSRDSIGHIMVATEEDKLLVFNILSAIETRRDSVPVIGLESWIDFNQISFEQLERLGVVLIGQNYFDFSADNLSVFKSSYKDSFNTLPTQFSYSGYESMLFFGEQLINFGNYFQYGLYSAGYQSGYLYKGFDYTRANDNQFVPVLRLVNLDLEIIPSE